MSAKTRPNALQLNTCYFANLNPFSVAELRVQMAELEEMLANIAGLLMSEIPLFSYSDTTFSHNGTQTYLPRVLGITIACTGPYRIHVAPFLTLPWHPLHPLGIFLKILMTLLAVGKQHKNKRRTLYNQIERVQSRITALEAGHDTYVSWGGVG